MWVRKMTIVPDRKLDKIGQKQYKLNLKICINHVWSWILWRDFFDFVGQKLYQRPLSITTPSPLSLPPISTTLQTCSLQFIGCCWRRKNEIISHLLLWNPSNGRRSRRSPATTFIGQLERDTGLTHQELLVIMAEKGVWRKLIIHKAVMEIFQIPQKARATCN